MANTRIIISTENPLSDKGPIQFNINPSNVSISQPAFKAIKKARRGFIKTYVGNGLITLSFSGTLSLNTEEDLKLSKGWVFFEKFAEFVRYNQGFLFRLNNVNTPIQIPGFTGENPSFVGDLDVPSYEQDAEEPWKLNYSFVFTGSLVDSSRASVTGLEATLETVEV